MRRSGKKSISTGETTPPVPPVASDSPSAGTNDNADPDISLRGRPEDCEPEWLLAGKTKDEKPIIPKHEQAWAAIWEYSRENSHLRTLGPIYRDKLEPAYQTAWDFAAEAYPEDVGDSRFEALLQLHLSTLVDSVEHAKVGIIVFKVPGVVECVSSPYFPQTPWRRLSPEAKVEVIGDRWKTGTESIPLAEDQREVAYLLGPPVRLICEIGDDNRLPQFWFASLKGMLKGTHFLNLALHIDLNANAEDAGSSFRRLFADLKRKHNVSEKPRPKGRQGAGDQLPAAASDLLKQLGALRLHFLATNPHQLATHAERLGYTSKSGERNECVREIGKSVKRAAAKARSHFATMFGADAIPIHSPKRCTSSTDHSRVRDLGSEEGGPI